MPSKQSEGPSRKESASSPSSGRPKGSKTKKLATQTVDKPRCSQCESTHTLVSWSVTRQISGKDPSGKPYTSITWQRRKCQSCRNVFNAKIFENK